VVEVDESVDPPPVKRLITNPSKNSPARTAHPVVKQLVFRAGGAIMWLGAGGAIGRPQFGQVGARSETCCLQSGHSIIGIVSSPLAFLG
jgi:hypothetical protein